jgi:hypothetical protein
MIEMLVNLDFDCCFCTSCVGVKLKCAGKGLWGGANIVATVKVPCPTCNNINELYFEPSGKVRAVCPCQVLCGAAEPSLN